MYNEHVDVKFVVNSKKCRNTKTVVYAQFWVYIYMVTAMVIVLEMSRSITRAINIIRDTRKVQPKMQFPIRSDWIPNRAPPTAR